MWNNQKQQKRYFPLCQTYYQFKLDFQKVAQYTGAKWLIHGTKTPQGQSVAKPETPL